MQNSQRKEQTAETGHEKEEKEVMKQMWSDIRTLRTRLGRHWGVRRGKLEFGENDELCPGHRIWRSQPRK